MTGHGASRLGVGIIGAGRVGPVIGRALAGVGHAITGIHAGSEESRERAGAMLPGVPVLEVEEVVRRSELVLFAIPGDQLPGLVEGLTSLGAWQPGQLVLHTAPELGHSVFAPALAAGVIPLALHPAIVFTGTSLDLGRLSASAMAVTAPAPVLPIGQALAVEMGAEPVVVADEDRAEYADAVAAAQDLTRAVIRQATATLTDLGADIPRRIVGGIVHAVVEEELSIDGDQPEEDPLA